MPSAVASIFKKLLPCAGLNKRKRTPSPTPDRTSRASTHESKTTKRSRSSRGRSPTPRHSMMGPTIHCVRHAEGYHNLRVENHQLRDPQLTPKGVEQCQQLQKDFLYSKDVDLIVASPLKRTIYTALIAFDDVLKKKKLRIVALPEVQETSDMPCDTGCEVEELEREFAGKPVDFDLVKPGWNNKRMKWAPAKDAIARRACTARCWLRDRPEKNIVLVTHGGFLHYFTEDFTDSELFPGTGWANTEFRSYGISSQRPDEAHLIETSESRRRRKGDEKSLDESEKENLKRTISQEERMQAQAHRAQMLSEKIRDDRRDEIGAYA